MPTVDQIGLTSRQVQTFIADGFVKIENAFSTDLAKRCRDELWADIGLSPDEPEKWTQPVVRVGFKASRPFIEAANSPCLHQAYDQLVGNGCWPARKVLEPFRSASPRRKPLPTSGGMWT